MQLLVALKQVVASSVWFIYKKTRETLILSARQMDSKEKRRFGKK